ncbi:relaxase/mobilization nuclease domain-containing protein [Dysgonomonas sp. GY617]|uniref:relaxase/mobilization nuclease domain-containing protein n=1 Tax=Dysgonomonas sp. GY617 TaxID=2780420 RepID=UPI00188444DE|nr:relaxase/mobilization nuclease domain-containing protein [Dysgonomonas sp. GY617]MBF0577593.1 relaxase/mobilization nuclease domain-containing protein [Dysgonomonas sp. GY617]
MIAKAKAISHGSRAIEYAMRESKKGNLIASNLIQNNVPNKIYKEFVEAQKYNDRCKNKFIRIEIGIAPKDEAKLTNKELAEICRVFSQKFGFENNQWIACTHRDTDNLHVHMIVNRVSIDNKVYDTSFISKRAGKIAEEISRKMGLTIANEVQRKEKYRPEVTSFERMMARSRIEKASLATLSKKPKSLNDFAQEMRKRGIEVAEAKNKKGNTYGLRFFGYGQTFKASQIGKEFGYRTLLNTFSENRLQENQLQHQSQTGNRGASIVGEVISGLGSIFTPTIHGNLEDEYLTEEQRKKKRKKKRGYGRQQ